MSLVPWKWPQDRSWNISNKFILHLSFLPLLINMKLLVIIFIIKILAQLNLFKVWHKFKKGPLQQTIHTPTVVPIQIYSDWVNVWVIIVKYNWLSQYSQTITEHVFSRKFLPHSFYKFLTTKHSSPFIAYQHVVITFKYYQVRVLCDTNMFETNEKSK